MTLSEDLWRALTTMSRLDVELDIRKCRLAYDAAGAFAECLRGDGGPVKLNRCIIGSQTIASALTGKSRVTKLWLYHDHRVSDNAGMAVLFRALASNKGLVDLDIQNQPINDENWTILCESLQAHPTLTSLDLRYTRTRHPTGGLRAVLSDKAHRTRVVADMMQNNTVLHTIDLYDDERDDQIYEEMIHPYLETNRYRPRIHAIKKADISIRRPLLGLALQTVSVRNSSNLLWMFLSGNADVVLQSHEDGEQVVEVAASVPAEVAASVQVVVDATCKRKR
jgi:hypothetical protein